MSNVKKPRKKRVSLSEKDLKDIGKMIKKCVPIRQIARMYDVAVPTVYYHFKGGVRICQPSPPAMGF